MKLIQCVLYKDHIHYTFGSSDGAVAIEYTAPMHAGGMLAQYPLKISNGKKKNKT